MSWEDILKKDKEFKPHMMFDPKTGKGFMANKMADHLRMKGMGYLHEHEMKVKKEKKPFKGYNKKIHARTGGLSAKGRAKFKREQGSNLKPPVTTKPSKLKRGSKAAKRRKSFCARSKGFKRDDGTYSEKAKAARRRWNC